ncbi:MAG: four helix bundle protein [Saprospiraceae bacterium]|jgi:four helix bundle protein|nr:four helix bundle protein [Saprospiraceae bacterium]
MGNFKGLRIWQDAVILAEHVYRLTNTGRFSSDYGLKNQIQRAVVSISSNIAEGDERGSTKEAVHFFHIAKGSAAEVITQLTIAYRIGYLDAKTYEEIENETEKLRASINKFIQARGGYNPLKLLLWSLLP